METYANTTKAAETEKPKTPPPRKPIGEKRTPQPPRRQNATESDADDLDAPAIPPKDPELLKEVLQNGQHSDESKERPVPKTRKTVPPRVKIPPPEVSVSVSIPDEPQKHDVVEPVSSPGLDNPLYDGIIEITKPGKPLPEIPAAKKTKPKKKDEKKKTKGRGKKNKKAEAATPEMSSSAEDLIAAPVYELAQAVTTSAAGHTSTDDRGATPSRKEPPKPQPRKSKETHPETPTTSVGSVIIDKYYYNFLCTFKSSELEGLKGDGTLRTVPVHGGTPRDIEVRFKSVGVEETAALEEKFLAFYDKAKRDLRVESVNVTQVRDLTELQNELQDKYESLCFHVSDKQMDVVVGKSNQSVIKRCIVKHGGFSVAPEIATPVLKASKKRANENEPSTTTTGAAAAATSKPAVNFPIGYDVGGAYRLLIYIRDITTLRLDAIVNAANEKLVHGGGVARAISDAAGSELEKASRASIRKKKQIPVTEVVRTTAGKLPCHAVIHAVGPKWPKDEQDEDKQRECLNQLTKTFENVLELASKEGLKTLAIPPISTGIYRVPPQKAAKSILDALVNSADPDRKLRLSEIHIVDINDIVLANLVALLGDGGRFKAASNKSIAVTELDSSDIQVPGEGESAKPYKELIGDSPNGKPAKAPVNRRMSFFGKLCGAGRKKNKYN